MRAGKARVWLFGVIATMSVIVGVATVAALAWRPAVYAAGSYGSGEQGYDISWPQCGSAYPSSPYAFGIVGVTNGRAFTLNPCLSSEYAWAQASANPGQLSLYMNLNSPAGSTATEGQSGPYGACKKNTACYSRNYGWNAAQYAYTQNGAFLPYSASIWWLDIETGNSWSRNTTLNAGVIQGAIDFFQAQKVTVGVYSTPTQWKTIAGTYAPATPNWVAGASASNPGATCSTPLYPGGVVWLTQYVSGSFDVDTSC